jgi:hypothetical protein
MPKRPSKYARELDSLAEFIVDSAVGKPHKGDLLPDGRDPATVALGRSGTVRGGKARTALRPKKKGKRVTKKGATARRKTRLPLARGLR